MNLHVSNNFDTPISRLGCIELKGPDSRRFLQGQITIDADKISIDSLALGSVCNPQGRCIALFWATGKNESIYLILPKDNIPATLAHLAKYAVFFKTELSEKSEDFHFVGSYGSDSKSPIPQSLSVASSNLSLAFFERAESPDFTLANQPIHEDLWWWHLIESRIPWLDNSAASEFLPHNLDLPHLNAVDFTKGCFTGQEVIARMQYKGKLKSHLQLLKSNSPLNCDSCQKLFVDESIAGEVVCSASTAETGTNVLALIKDKYLDAQIFRLNDKNGPILDLQRCDQEHN